MTKETNKRKIGVREGKGSDDMIEGQAGLYKPDVHLYLESPQFSLLPDTVGLRKDSILPLFLSMFNSISNNWDLALHCLSTTSKKKSKRTVVSLSVRRKYFFKSTLVSDKTNDVVEVTDRMCDGPVLKRGIKLGKRVTGTIVFTPELISSSNSLPSPTDVIPPWVYY